MLRIGGRGNKFWEGQTDFKTFELLLTHHKWEGGRGLYQFKKGSRRNFEPYLVSPTAVT